MNPISLLLPLTFTVGLFFLGRFFIRRPEAPTRFFTFGMQPTSRFGIWWFRLVGYFFCGSCVLFWVLTPIYLIVYLHQRR
jgi:hypothetical protein